MDTSRMAGGNQAGGQNQATQTTLGVRNPRTG
jgi:hypothetical protein